ncbi:MAG: hypothetical protein Q9215_007891 [Flavoplaca cf. flavocitrina]
MSEVGISWVFSRLGDQLHTSRESPDVKLWGDRLSIAGGYRMTTSAFPWEAAAWVIQQMAIRRAKAEKSPLRNLGGRCGMGVLLDENQDPLVTTYSGTSANESLDTHIKVSTVSSKGKSTLNGISNPSLQRARKPASTSPTQNHNSISQSIMVPSRPVPGCLPAELRLQILECCADVPTAVSLACTSKAFYSTWENFYQPVCERILKRSIECYDDALCLARAQEDPGQPTNFKECASRILSNAKIVEEACYALPTAVGEESSSEMEDWPSPTELTRFFHAYYVIWTKHIMRLPDRSSLEKAPEKMCETGSLREHYTVTIFWYWLRDCQEDSWIKP